MDNENTNNKKTGRLRSVIVILCIVAAVVIVLAILWSPVISPALKHLKANKLISDGDYESAYAILHELGDEEAILESEYNRAMKEVNEGKIIEAYETFVALDGYKDSTEQAASLYVKYEIEKIKMAEVGDYVIFGAYEQDNDISNGKEDIEWLVLDKQNDKILAISKYGLDCQRYHEKSEDVTWETCTLRKWLNSDFINAAFSPDEIAMIPTVCVAAERDITTHTDPGNATQDKVFLLSAIQAEEYFSSNSARQCKPTDFAVAKGAYKYAGGGTWWLRSPGFLQSFASTVLADGAVNPDGYAVSKTTFYFSRLDGSNDIIFDKSDTYTVRPALWINFGT